MLSGRLAVPFFAVALAAVAQGCTGRSPERMIDQHDHPGLAMYYSQQAEALREKAKHWEFMAEFYERHPEQETEASGAHAAHCRAIAQSYNKAADEAEALAREHRAMRPHGVVD